MKIHTALASCLLFASLALPVACSDSKMTTEEKQQATREDVDATIEKFKKKDPVAAKEFGAAYAYAVYPSIGKGGFIIGGFGGGGLVFQGGKLVAKSTVGGGTIGAQIGGQSYAQVTFFKDKGAFDKFKRGEVAFNAGASAVAAGAGTGTAVPYKDGVATYVITPEGLMAEAVIGGQTFSYEPLDGAKK